MKHCPKCNGLMPEDAMHCIRCGFELGMTSVPNAVPQPPAPAAAPVARQAGVSEPDTGAGEKGAQRVGPKELLIAVVVVAVMLSLAWLKETGNVYAAIAFAGLTFAALVSNLIILRRRKKADEKGATRQSEQMPKQIRYAIGAVVVALVMDAALTPPLGFAIDVAINGLLLFLVAKRHNWARWTFVVLAGLAVLGSIPRLFAKFGSEPWSTALGALDATLTVLAIVLLLTRPAAQWCNKNYDKTKNAGA